MDSNLSIHSLKPNLSQLLMRTFEQLEDPKYATVPKTHWDELRPSILSKYHIEDVEHVEHEHLKSERDLSKDDDWKNHCEESSSTTSPTIESTAQYPTSRCSSKPLSFRAFNWRIQPIWRYCASAVHMQQTARAGKTKRKASRKLDDTTPISSSFPEEAKEKWRSHSYEQLEKSQHSVPAFEVLPSLFENRTHSLLYQNSYLLDGVKYDYISTKTQHQHAKLYFNYMRFLKSINKPTRPSDRDIIFGEAKVVTNPSPHWEGARIDWLLNLERKQEMRKLETLEQEKQLAENQRAIDLARKEAKIKQKELKNAEAKEKQHKTKSAANLSEPSQHEKRKFLFLKKLKKSADGKKKKVPRVELLPTL